MKIVFPRKLSRRPGQEAQIDAAASADRAARPMLAAEFAGAHRGPPTAG